jgi:hypothetical protein
MQGRHAEHPGDVGQPSRSEMRTRRSHRDDNKQKSEGRQCTRPTEALEQHPPAIS